jgi:methionyl aminopeptidase
MTVTDEEELEQLKRIGRIVALALQAMSRSLEPGITTRELDQIGKAVLQAHGARSAPVLVYHFPGSTCISINDEAAHGIPGDRVVQAGDLVNIDVSAELNGYYADTGASFAVPPVSAEDEYLLRCGKAALKQALGSIRAGRRLNAIGRAVENHARACNLNVIRSLHGHGVGRGLHEEPRAVPNYYNPLDRRTLTEGQVIAIEPFLTPGNGQVFEKNDGWTIQTADGQRLAQFEHTIVVTRGAPLVLTAL